MQCLKLACNSMYQMAQSGQLTVFPPTYFDLVIAGGGGGVEITPLHFFLDREMLLIDLKLSTHTK